MIGPMLSHPTVKKVEGTDVNGKALLSMSGSLHPTAGSRLVTLRAIID